MTVAIAVALTACTAKLPENAQPAPLAQIYPDYAGVTIPCNIAPMNFKIMVPADEFLTHIHHGDQLGMIVSGPVLDIDQHKWRKMLEEAQGDSIAFDIYARVGDQWLRHAPVKMAVATPIDRYISYRLIEPSYVSFEEMRICQRDLQGWDETMIYGNAYQSRDEKGQCVNCHSYQDYFRTGNMQLHRRANNAGTMIVSNGGLDAKLVDLKRPETIGPGVYPSWHPTLPVIAYSVNKTDQLFHSRNRNKIEVQDAASDLILYDVEKDQVSIICNDSTQLECFPYWNHDGTALYYVSAQLPDSIDSSNIKTYKQNHYRDIKYDIFCKPFDAATLTFGPTDTIFMASAIGKSAIHPRESRDGRYLMFAMADYGVFHIWHHDADLYLMDLADGSVRPMSEVNSPDTESYHSFSSQGDWFVFSSRRDDGNYTRLYISHFNPDGTASKPFLLPQRSPDHNTLRYKSYNVPEFMLAPVPRLNFVLENE